MTITPSENIKKEVDKKISDVIRNRIIQWGMKRNYIQKQLMVIYCKNS